jgi:organic radical activating enzyme
MNNPVICIQPFNNIYNAPGKSYSPCCWGGLFNYSPDEVLPLSHFTGDEMNRIRKEMLNGEKTEFLEKFCSKCWQKEKEYGHSPRLDEIVSKSFTDNFNEDGVLGKCNQRFLKISLNIFGNQCNLQCYECLPHNSSSRISVMKKLDPQWSDPKNFPHFNDKEYDLKKTRQEQFNDVVNNLVDNADKIRTISVVGGEPMLMKSHFHLLDRLIECGHSKEISLNYCSNMTVTKLSNMKKYFDNFKSTFLQWSVDSIGERNTWLRYPTNWEETLLNVFEIKTYLRSNLLGIIESTITPTILSITSFKDTYNWLLENELISIKNKHVNVVSRPEFLRPHHLPQNLKEEISEDILKISKYRYNQLMETGDEQMFKKAIEYCDALDKQRGTNWRTTFPEIAKYAD